MVMGGPGEAAAPTAHEVHEFVEESGPTVVMGDPVDIAPPSFVKEPPKTEFIPKPPVPPPAPPSPPPPRAAAATPTAPAAPSAPAPRAPRPAATSTATSSAPTGRSTRPPGPGASQSIPAARRPAARPQPAPRPEDEIFDEEPKAKGGPPVALYAGLGPTAANVPVGRRSAAVDNAPVMFAVLAMDPPMAAGQWLLVTLTAGVGGSLLAIGSAAGGAPLGQARGSWRRSGRPRAGRSATSSSARATARRWTGRTSRAISSG